MFNQGLGVKILKNNILVISMLKRHNRLLGPGEAAGLRLGDIIFGANFRPCVEGVRSLLHNVKYSLRLASLSSKDRNPSTEQRNRKESKSVSGHGKEPVLRPVITLQCWRCHQLCSDQIPGRLFPRADDVFVQGYSLFRNRVLSEWERWNFNDILLSFLKKELKIRLEDEVKMIATLGANPRIRVIHNEVLDLERNILKAKGLRTALCVRIVHTKFIDDAVLYVLRVEDEESGLQWNVRKRYNDFYALHKELSGLSRYLNDISFPKKRIVHSRLSLRVIEERIVALEQFIRHAVHRLTLYSTTDAQASQSLCKVQEFLDVGMFINCLKPPPLDDQRFLELMTYRRLNDFSSLSCQQCIRFVDSVDLDALAQNDKSNGYLPMLELVAQALREVEQYAIQQYGQQMNQILKDRRPQMSEDKVRSFVMKCVRRQVEGAIYLPLRRAIFRIVYSFIADKAERLQKSMKILKRAPIKIFFEKGNYDELHLVKSLPLAVAAFQNLVNAFLPSDQGNMLMRAAGAVMEVISEVEAVKNGTLPSRLLPALQERDSDLELPPPSPGKKKRNSLSLINSPTKGVEMKASRDSDSANSVSGRRRTLSLAGYKKNKYESDPEGRLASQQSFSNDFLNKSVLADPAGTIFSADEHVLVDKRDFDRDGAQSNSVQSDADDDEEEEESPSEKSLSLIDDASLGNDSFRELYSILKAEGRDDNDRKQVHKVMRDMAAAAISEKDEPKVRMTEVNQDILNDLLERPFSERHSSYTSNNNSERSASPCSNNSNNSSSSNDDVDSRKNRQPLYPSSPATSGLDLSGYVRTSRASSEDSSFSSSDDPGMSISSSITQTLLASSAPTAIRGSSVVRLEGSQNDSQPLFKPSEERVETYMSPFKTKADLKTPPSVSDSEGNELANKVIMQWKTDILGNMMNLYD
jgi:hypothetical protein